MVLVMIRLTMSPFVMFGPSASTYAESRRMRALLILEHYRTRTFSHNTKHGIRLPTFYNCNCVYRITYLINNKSIFIISIFYLYCSVYVTIYNL